FANAEYDKGPIIAQKAVPVREGDTVDDLEARIHTVEHKIYPKVVGWLADGRVSIDENRHVVIAGK
ncbi:MAG: formyltransferase family protein, partial [Coriobacteriaceae bacterium]|nr:formyltransferase family protein [Coriobacteriaceae bacterium]